MKLIKSSYEILSDINSDGILKAIEVAGRTCYKSEDKITSDSAKEFVRKIIKSGHESVIEHRSLSIRFVCDRGVGHELVRHRLASFSQESTGYCNYSNDKFDNQITFIIPEWLKEVDGCDIVSDVYFWNKDLLNQNPTTTWMKSLILAEDTYNSLLKDHNWTPQQARSVPPNSLKTEIVITANLREWRTIFKQRTSKAAHPQMRELMCPLLDELKEKLPVIFDDISYE